MALGHEGEKAGCPFCEIDSARIAARQPSCFAVFDQFPVTLGHMLIIPNRHIADYFDLEAFERHKLDSLLQQQRDALLEKYPEITGFNVGINCGMSAGQTVMHVHVHLIPRRDGDVANPRGGVRGVIPGRQNY